MQTIDFEAALNAEQLAAVTAGSGPALVLAGAGSGKTRTLTYRVAYLLEQGLKPWEILLLTFTNKASREMLGRAEEITGCEPRQFWGGTFHHIGQKMLRMHGGALSWVPNYTILDAGDADSLLTECIKSTQSAFLKDKANPRARVIGDIISYAANTLQTVEDVVRQRYAYYLDQLDDIEAFAQAYTDKKRQGQVVDYDDLLLLWYRLLVECPEVATVEQARFQAILVDEYQDTNALQSAIIDRLAPQHQIMAVGDDAQCIYTWRGADIDNIIGFPDRHPGTAIYKIQTNYRSTPQILHFANAILPDITQGEVFSKELHSPLPGGPKPYRVSHVDTRTQAQFILRRIRGLVSQGYALSDIAILYRAHYQALDLQLELSRSLLPFEITSGVQFFEQAHIRDLVAQLRFVHNIGDETAFTRFASLLPKVGPKTAQRLLKLAHKETGLNQTLFQALSSEAVLKKVPEAAKELWTDMAYSLEQVAGDIKRSTPQQLLGILIEGWYADLLPSLYPNAGARQDDLESLVEFAGRYGELEDLLAQLVLLNSELGTKGKEPTGESLKLSTVHQSKGLEFPVVFVIGLSQNMFPLKRAIEEGDLSEEQRLFYVAVTRAQKELYLCSPKMQSIGGPPMLLRPSTFLEAIPMDRFELLHMS